MAKNSKRRKTTFETNEKHLHSLIQTVGSVILYLSPGHKILEFNREAERLYGKSREEVLGEDYFELFLPEDIHEKVAVDIKKVLGGEPTQNFENTVVAYDGSLRILLWNVVRMLDENEKPIGIICCGQDITDRKQAEEGLQRAKNEVELRVEEKTASLLQAKVALEKEIAERKRSEKALQLTQFSVDRASDPTFFLKSNGNLSYVNEAACWALGHSKDELLSMNVTDISPDMTPEIWTQSWDELRQRGSLTLESRHQRKDGSIFPVEISRNYIVFNGNEYNCAFARNITDRKRAEVSEYLAATVFNSAADAIMVTDADEKIISVNPAFIKITGYLEEEVIGQTPRMFKSGKHDRAFYREMWNILSAIGQWQGEIWDRRKNGEVYPKWLSIIAVKDEKGKTIHYTGLFSDITKRKNLEKQLRQSQKLETIGQLAGGVAHEFNNILTPITGYVDIVLEQTSQQPEVQEYLLMAQKAARRAATLTKELLAFSRQKPVNLLPQSLFALVEEVQHLLSQTIDRRIEITVESVDALWTVLADMDQIHQVIINLCINARDALKECMIEGGDFKPLIKIKVENVYLDLAFCISHLGAKVGDFVCLSVSDNGPGIDEDILPHLFEPFFTTKEVGQGTGLGLASCYGIIKRHKGWIGLKTTKGKGTTFEIYLPRTKRPGVMTGIPVTSKPLTTGTETIMIVDDDEFIRSLGKAVLTRCGYTVLLAEEGDQALDIFRQEHGRISLVVLDLTMPHQSGWEVLRRLRMLDPALKVVISSGNNISGQTRDIDDLGSFTLLSKPFSPSKMEQTIREVLDQDDQPSKEKV